MFEICEHNGFQVIKLLEEINAYNISKFRKVFFAALEEGDKDIFLDFQNLDYIDSAGISVLLLCHKRMNEHNRNVTFVNVTANISQIITMAGLGDIFTIYANMPEELAAC